MLSSSVERDVVLPEASDPGDDALLGLFLVALGLKKDVIMVKMSKGTRNQSSNAAMMRDAACLLVRHATVDVKERQQIPVSTAGIARIS